MQGMKAKQTHTHKHKHKMIIMIIIRMMMMMVKLISDVYGSLRFQFRVIFFCFLFLKPGTGRPRTKLSM